MSSKRSQRNTRAFHRGPGGKKNPPGTKLLRRVDAYRKSTGVNYALLVERSCYGRRSERF